MRTALSFFILLIAATGPVYAEETSVSEDVGAYCNEQAQLAGIEDVEELRQYVQECIDSYSMPSAE